MDDNMTQEDIDRYIKWDEHLKKKKKAKKKAADGEGVMRDGKPVKAIG